jgi:hypothetical protein
LLAVNHHRGERTELHAVLMRDWAKAASVADAGPRCGLLRRTPSERTDGRRRKRNSFEDEQSALIVTFEFALMD